MREVLLDAGRGLIVSTTHSDRSGARPRWLIKEMPGGSRCDAALAEVVRALYAYMRGKYRDVEVRHPQRFGFKRQVCAALKLDQPLDPVLSGSERKS